MIFVQDPVGNTASTIAHYNVVYDFSDFLLPIKTDSYIQI